MTDNISRMYRLMNIEAKPIGCTNEDIYNPEYYCNDCEGDCIDCTWYDEDEVYPPFTEFKQLELIKWIASTRPINISNICGDWIIEGMIRYEKKYNDFSQALAGLVCKLWENLTDEQKEEIRRILE